MERGFMASSVRNSKLENRTQRSKLAVAHRPVWVGIGQGLYLGYRKGVKGGAWIARYYIEKGKYVTEKLGKADDHQDANGLDVLSYFEAQECARAFANQQVKLLAGDNHQHSLTVAEAIENYLNWFKAHRKSFARTQHVVRSHVLPALGDKLINKLTPQIIRQWHEALIKEPPRLRSTAIKQNYAEFIETPEALRKRKATANRVLTVLKAALNHAWRDGYVVNDEAWRKVKPFHNVNLPKVRYLELHECERLINVCEPDFRQLVRAALLTGCRYGELIRLVKHDFNAKQGVIHIRETKNGKPRFVPLTQEGITFFEQATIGKLGNALIFTHSDESAWGTSHQSRRLLGACKLAKILPAISFHVLRHTYGSILASKGVPLQVIAELLGHSDTRITSQHYAHLMPSFVSDTLRANLPMFIKEEKKINIIKVRTG
jgi:integrase